jgi:cell division protein ZapE
MPTPLQPLAAYHHAITENGFFPDAAQQQAAEALQQCHDSLNHGVYLWGPVGRGKTWLMDCFFHSLQVPARRQHFHHFMQWVHQRLFQLTGTPDPLRALAVELGQELRVLCFDELFVSDIGDAIILGNLFTLMFEQGVVLVATSNQPPQQLYADGFNRERFVPAIAAIEAHMQVVAIDGGEDHRLHPGVALQRYWPSAEGAPLAAVFAALSDGQAVEQGTLNVGKRSLVTEAYADSVLWCRFAELCEKPFAAADFIALCDRFGVILLSEVPNLSGQQRAAKIARGTEDGVQQVLAGDRQLPALSASDDSVRRFIALVDECYDRRVPLYVQAEVALEALYTEGYLAFAFRRTLSRLQEMQLARFGS